MVVRTVDLANPFLPSLDGVCEILLVRHGEQAYSENMALGDGMNPPLSDLGKRQAEAVVDERKRKYNNDSSDTLNFLQSFRLNYPKMTGEFESHGIELKVPFRHRKRAKELGARWDGHSWRIPVHATQDTIRDTLACFPMDLSRENFTGD